jgi:hypothetical protein
VHTSVSPKFSVLGVYLSITTCVKDKNLLVMFEEQKTHLAIAYEAITDKGR